MLSPNELSAMLKSTQAFIDADKTDLLVTRRPKTSNGSGGYTFGMPSVVGPIPVRLIPQSDRVPEITTNDGRVLRPKYVVMGMPDTDIQRDDTFTYNNNAYVVAAVHDGPEYEFKADVVRHG